MNLENEFQINEHTRARAFSLVLWDGVGRLRLR